MYFYRFVSNLNPKTKLTGSPKALYSVSLVVLEWKVDIEEGSAMAGFDAGNFISDGQWHTKAER